MLNMQLIAADATQVTTGIHWLDQLFVAAGALGVLSSILANVLPKSWALTHMLARLSADLRGITQIKPEHLPSKEPGEPDAKAKRAKAEQWDYGDETPTPKEPAPKDPRREQEE